ncbi:MAG: DUF2780 domain-containing protein [Acidobacteriota bacterium]
MDLLKSLSAKLGVTRDQARGGAGLLLRWAGQAMGPQDFSEAMKLLPEAQEFLAETVGMSGHVEEACLKPPSPTEAFPDLVSGFRSLGLEGGMVLRFLPFILAFVQIKGGDQINSLREEDLS